ncbi:MAG: cation-translocating P-type ATPase [Gemmatimonadota bacterium]
MTALQDGSCEVRLGVDGLRCASCVWVTERVLEATPGVVAATVSYATGRATLRWRPEQVDLATLARRIGQLGYRPRLPGEESRADPGLLLRLGVAVFAALNVMLVSAALYAGWFGTMEPRFVALFQWTALLLSTPVALWCAEPFFAGAWTGLRHRTLSMDVPIALAVAVLYAHGVWATLRGVDAYLDSLTMLVALLLMGRVLESGSRRRAAEAAVALAGTVPASARRLGRGGLERVAAAELTVGDRIEIGMGEEVAADGVVVEGSAHVRMALLTGESAPVPVEVGDRLVAGAVLESGSLVLEVDAVGSATVVRRMADALRTALDRPARESAVDRIAPWFTGVTLTVALGTAVAWWWLAGPARALEVCVAVLVVACPCALALSRPLAAAAGLGAAARRGLLIRSPEALLDLNHITTLALDKTGTVTAGELTVVEADDAAVRVAAALERGSVHPIARALVDEAVQRGIPLARAQDVREEPGVGVCGRVDGRFWQLSAGGPGAVLLRSDDGVVHELRMADTLREDSAQATGELSRHGVGVALLSGDRPEVATRVGARLGIDEIHAPLTPDAKVHWIEEQRSRGGRVLFVGDGVNDGPALAASDVGIAMGTGAASSVLVADGVVTGGSLLSLVGGFAAARAARTQIRSNQIRSIAYNALAVSAAAAGWINPLVAAVLMPLSSLLVIWGASRVEVRVRRSAA